MAKRAWLFGLILGIPLIGIVVSEGIRAYFNSELRAGIHARYPDVGPALVALVTIDRLCRDKNPSFADVCSTNSNLRLMSSAALLAGVVGLVLLLAIRVAGTVARSSRTLILYIFKPGLYFTAITLTALILVHAVIAMAVIYYGESALIGRIHFGIMIAIGIGGLLGILVMMRCVFSVLKKAETIVIGQSISQPEAPLLWTRVAEIADRLGALRPQNVVVGLEPNFFVTEANVFCLNGPLTGRTLYCSLPLMRILTAEEFAAIIGHELGHFKGLDTKFSEKFYPIYRGTASSILSLQATGGGSSASIALLPAIAILGYFLECFSVAEKAISRDRELAADFEGASVTSSAVIATGLVKVHAFSGLWNGWEHAAVEALQEGKAFINASKTYAQAVLGSAKPEALKGVAETHLSHPTDSHPPLSLRLDSLNITLAQVSESSLLVQPSASAIALVLDHEKREEEVSGAYQAMLVQRFGIVPPDPPDEAAAEAKVS